MGMMIHLLRHPKKKVMMTLVLMMHLLKVLVLTTLPETFISMMIHLPRLPKKKVMIFPTIFFVRKWAMKVVHIQAVTLKMEEEILEFDLDDYALIDMHQ